MIYSINFKKSHKNFLSQSAIAAFLMQSLKDTPMYRKSTGTTKEAFDIGMLAILESILKHNLPLSAVPHHNLIYYITNENSQEVINILKPLNKKGELTPEEMEFLYNMNKIINRLSLILHQYYLQRNDKKGIKSRNLLEELKEEFNDYHQKML